MEPTAADLAAIEADWPLIAAELDVIQAECRILANPADQVATRAHRRAVRALLAVHARRRSAGAATCSTPSASASVVACPVTAA